MKTKNMNSLFPAFFNDFMNRGLMDGRSRTNFSNTNTTLPAVNIREDKDAFSIEVAAPGMRRADFSIKFENNQLIISSGKTEQNEEEQKKYHYTRREFSYQSFQRMFELPEHLGDGDKIEAKYCDGLLCVTMPKLESARPKPVKRIEIH